MPAMRRWFTTCVAILLAISLASCGRKAPWFAPAPAATTGTLLVLSSPGGADILVDGTATGRVTADTLRDLEAGEHVVRVRREGWVAAPESLRVEVVAQATARAEFTLSPVEEVPPQVVVLEAFSNVSCIGCPQMAATLRTLLAESGDGPDPVVLIDYATNWPALNDPHYQAAPAQNTARMSFYQSDLTVGIPTLLVNGALAGASGQPPPLDALRELVAGRLAGDPGFGVQVVASTIAGSTAIVARATLHAERAVARPGAVLAFALVQDPVTYVSPPGDQGETEFHWIMRDFVEGTEPPLPLAADESAVRTVTLTRQTAWPVADLHVIAFVQDPQTREILGAGHAVVTAAVALARRDLRSAALVTVPPLRTRTQRGRP